MAGLRSLLDQLSLLSSQLSGLRGYLRQRLSAHLASSCGSIDNDIDLFQAYRNDEAAVQQVGEAAAHLGCVVGEEATRREAELIDDIRAAAERTGQLLSILDTTTTGAVAIDSELPLLEFDGGAESDLISLAFMCARIERLRRRSQMTLADLKRRKGAERAESLRWLVWQLCELYARETGKPVTNSALLKNKFTSEPQSPAGRFVLAAAAALQPSDAWMQDHHQWVRGKRARVLHKGGLKSAVYFAMREYVALHFSSSGRRAAGSSAQ